MRNKTEVNTVETVVTEAPVAETVVPENADAKTAGVNDPALKEAAAAEAARKKAEKEAEKAAKKAAAEAKKAEKEAEKAAKLAAKEAAKMPTQNNVRRPKPDSLCGKAWAVFDEVSAQLGQAAPIAPCLKRGEELGLNTGNVRCEYAMWRKFHGITGRIEDPVKAAEKAQKAAEKEAAAKAKKEAAEAKKAEAAAKKAAVPSATEPVIAEAPVTEAVVA